MCCELYVQAKGKIQDNQDKDTSTYEVQIKRRYKKETDVGTLFLFF
jgi:hypothetical protein